MGMQAAEAALKELQDTFRQDKEEQVCFPPHFPFCRGW